MKKKASIKIKASAILYGFAVVSVLTTYIVGLLGAEKNYQEKLFQAFPEMSIISSKGNEPICYFAEFPEGRKYVLLSKIMGWGGPAMVATKVDTAGNVEDVKVVDHKETPAFFASLLKNEYFTQFINKNISDQFIIGEDINAVSGATISSQGFNKAIGESCHFLANAEFQMDIAKEKVHLSFSDPAYLLLLLFALAYYGNRLGLNKYQTLIHLSSIIILGFLLNFPLSMSHVCSLFMGFFPCLESSIVWYILLGSILAMILFVGKNFYCTWICPFGAVQSLLNKASGISLPVPHWLKKYGRISSGIIAWFSVCVIFLSRNPALGNFEPFAAIFGFKGFGIIWVVLPVLIFSSFFIKRMWCRFFCPVGFLLNGACKMRNSAINKMNLNNDEKRKDKKSIKHINNCA